MEKRYFVLIKVNNAVAYVLKPKIEISRIGECVLKIEMHVHTRYSRDSILCFWPLYLKCRLIGIDAIAITEHNNIDGGLEFQQFCIKRGNKVQVIVGEEILTDSGEIIGLYLKNKIEPGLSVQQTIEAIREQKGIVCIPHPHDEKRIRTVLKEEEIKRFRKQIDCIEVYNGRNSTEKTSEYQRDIVEKYGIKKVIGSDAHMLIEIGRNYMIADSVPANSEQFIQMLNKLELKQKKCLQIVHKITIVVKIFKLITEGKTYELYGSIVRKIKRDKH